jgi:hypothetical protein
LGRDVFASYNKGKRREGKNNGREREIRTDLGGV